jgi:hypothetical protein
MAGQPPEPSFQPSGQDQGLTQGRPAWQTPSYPPPGGASSGGQQGYAAPSYGAQDQAAYPPPDQAFPPPVQSYSGHEQTYTSLGQGQGQGQGQDYQNYQGYQPPSYGAPQGQGASVPPPGWQAAPGAPAAARKKKQPGEKGFIGSLFDFSFTSMVTPKIIKVLYVLFTIWTALIGLVILVIGFRSGGFAGGLVVLIIVEPIFLLLTLGIYRVVLEAFMVIFRIYDEMKKIRENTESQS